MEKAPLLIVCVACFATGIFCAARPERAATIWSADQLSRSPQRSRHIFFTCYRAFGMFFALVSVWFFVKIITG
jgi:hypothetical protein